VQQIPIANIYYLLCYAWDALEERDTLAEVSTTECPELLDLFARVLVNGTRRLIRRGLDRGYLPREDHIPGVRGKLLVTQTPRHDLLRRGRTACLWDDLDHSTLPNGIIKTTLLQLHDHGLIAPETAADVYDTLRWLAPIEPIDLRADHFRRVQLHRNNRIYAFLIRLCQFIYEHWLPDEAGRTRHFRDFLRDGLAGLFEQFVFNFYRHELGSEWQVTAPWIAWQMEFPNADALLLVPQMKTDVCLQTAHRAIILDAKFYARALKEGAYGAPKLASANLYQLFTYLRQKSNDSGWQHAEGILLYPRTTSDINIDFTTQGHRLRAVAIDLAAPHWHQIHAKLLQLVAPTTAPSATAPSSMQTYSS
jgi:5-methylcytosine-specific restriction enzyme subunit McrC